MQRALFFPSRQLGRALSAAGARCRRSQLRRKVGGECATAFGLRLPLAAVVLGFALGLCPVRAQQQMQIVAGLASPGSEFTAYNPGTCPTIGDICLLSSQNQIAVAAGPGACKSPYGPLPSDQPAKVPLCNFGYSGDGAAGIYALLDYPAATAEDKAGNLYIVDTGNSVIRKLDASGNITTYGWLDSSGAFHLGNSPGAPGTNGVAVWPSPSISSVAVDGLGNVIPGIQGGGGGVIALATDPQGNVYSLADVPGSEGVGQTIGGNNRQYSIGNGLSFDQNYVGLAVDGAGNIYTIASTGTQGILKIGVGGDTTLISPPTAGAFDNAGNNALAVDASGNLYALLNGGSEVGEYSPTTQTWAIVAGIGTDAFNNPNSGGGPLDLYSPTVDAPMPATLTGINAAAGLSIDPNGTLYIADTGNNMVRRFAGSGPVGGCFSCGPTTLAITDPIPTGGFTSDWALNPVSHKLYLVNRAANAVTVFRTADDGVQATILVGKAPGPIAVDSLQNVIYVANTADNSLTVINGATDQVIATVALPGSPLAVATDPALDKAFVLLQNGGESFPSPSLPAVSVITGPTAGNPAAVIAGIGASNSPVALPGASAIAVDTQRNQVYVRFLGPANLGEENYEFAQIDAGSDSVVTTASLGTSGSTNIASDSLAVNEGNGNVVVADGFDPYIHVYVLSNQAFGSAVYAGANAAHVAVDSNHNIEYVADDLGNIGFLDELALTHGSVNTVPSNAASCGAGSSVMAADPATDQLYFTSCTTAGGSSLSLFDGNAKQIQATLALGAPSSGGTTQFQLLVDSSNPNPAMHAAWLQNALVSPFVLDVINGPSPIARPAIQFALGPDLGIANTNPFADVGVGQTATLEVRVKNVGAGALTELLPAVQDTQDPGSLQVSTNACSLPLAPGATCFIDISFTPSQIENFSGALLAFDDAADTPQSLALSGSGVPALGPATIAPNVLQPAVVGQSYGQAFSLSGAATLANDLFSITDGNLPPGLSVAGSSIFGTPTAAGTYNFTLVVTNSGTPVASQAYSLVVLASAAAATTVQLTGATGPQVVAFGPIQVGLPSSMQTIRLLNNGSANLTIASVVYAAGSHDFTETDTCAGQTLASFGACTISFVFSPTAAPTAIEAAEWIVTGANAAISPIYLTGTSALELGQPTLPTPISVDNGNPPNLAQAIAAVGCYPPECGSGSGPVGALSAGGKAVAFSATARNLPGPALPAAFAGGPPLSGAYLRTTCVGGGAGCEPQTQFIAYGPAGTSAPGANNGLPCVSTSNLNASGSFSTGMDSAGADVAFESDSCGFTGQGHTSRQIFLRNVASASTALVSLDASGLPADNGASGSSMSASGQYFAFQSASDNLLAGVSGNGSFQIFLRDNRAATNTLVTSDGAGNFGNANSSSAAISSSGRYVAFASFATNLNSAPADNDSTGLGQIYLYDSCLGAAPGCKPSTLLISVDANGNAAGGSAPSVSSDGRFVVFTSAAGALVSVASPPSIASQTFLRDTCLSNGFAVTACVPQTILVSQAAGQPGTVNSGGGVISPDGLLVTFNSAASNLNPQLLFGSVPVFKYTNCLAAAAPSPCPTGLTVITLDGSGNQLQNITAGSLVDATDQFFLFQQSSSGNNYNPATELWLGSTAASGPLSLLPASPLTAWLDEPFSQVFTTAGGSGNAAFSESGTLPAWLSFDASTGTLSGTPSGSAGPLSFSITATGPSGAVTNAYTLNVNAPLQLAPSPVDFGAVEEGTNLGMALTLTNVSPNPIINQLAAYLGPPTTPFGFAATGSNCSGQPLASGASCQLVLQYTPNAVGAEQTNTLQLTFANGASESVGVQGIGTAPPALGISPASMPAAYMGLFYSLTFTEVNTVGTPTFSLNGALPAGFVFNPVTATMSGVPLGPASPAGTGAFSVTITDINGSFTQPYTLSVLDPLQPMPLVVGFTTVPDGSTTTATLQLSNTSTLAFPLGAATLPAQSPFSILATGTSCVSGLSLPPGASCSYNLQFAPASPGTVNQNLTIPYGTFGAAEVVGLQGTGEQAVNDENESIAVHDLDFIIPLSTIQAPVLAFSAASLGFGSPAQGTAVTQTITASNIGLAPATLTSASIAPSGGPFAVAAVVCSDGTTSLPDTLAPGAACNITVNYTGSASPSSDSAAIVFTDNAALSNVASIAASGAYTQSIPLAGSGTSAAAPPPPPNAVQVSDAETITVSDSDFALPEGISIVLAAAPVLGRVAGPGSDYQVVVSLKNNGAVPVNLSLTTAALGTQSYEPSAASTVTSAAGVVPGAVASFTLVFPASSGAPGAGSVLRLSGAWAYGPYGGNFTPAARVRLPQ